MNFLGVFLLVVCAVMAAVTAQVASSRNDPVVQTQVGVIKGVEGTDGNYSMYLGIPYGVVDHENPFAPSTPYPPFAGTFEANNDSEVCPQLTLPGNIPTGSLDCLALNVYVPHTASSQNRLPVLVFIHGGVFAIGSTERNLYGPSYLVRHDVILVTFNYRLGPYGFMCLGTSEVPGNQGLKDQAMALRWVRDNIEAFGGDVDRMTLMGQSAGSGSVDFFLHYSPENYFRNIILLSGTVFSPNFIRRPTPGQAVEVARNLGIETNSTEEALRSLASADPLDVIVATPSMEYFGPCIENVNEGVEHYLTDYPINIDVPNARNISILIGFTDFEMSAPELQSTTNWLFDPTNDHVFQDVLDRGFNFDTELGLQLESIVRRFYIGDAEHVDPEMRVPIIEFYSDFVFDYPTQRGISNFLQNGAGNIYHYLFTYVKASERSNDTYVGAAHADELEYLFNSTVSEFTPEDQLLSQRMTTMWTNFAKYSDPTPNTTSELLPVKWTPIANSSTYHYLDIGSELKMDMRPFHQRMAFFDLLYEAYKEYEHGYRVNSP